MKQTDESVPQKTGRAASLLYPEPLVKLLLPSLSALAVVLSALISQGGPSFLPFPANLFEDRYQFTPFSPFIGALIFYPFVWLATLFPALSVFLGYCLLASPFIWYFLSGLILNSQKTKR